MFHFQKAMMDSGDCIEIEDHSFELPSQGIGHFGRNEDVIIITDNEEGGDDAMIADEIIRKLIEMGLEHVAERELVNKFLLEAPNNENKVNQVIEMLLDRFSETPDVEPTIINVFSLKDSDFPNPFTHNSRDNELDDVIEIIPDTNSNFQEELGVIPLGWNSNDIASSSNTFVKSFQAASPVGSTSAADNEREAVASPSKEAAFCCSSVDPIHSVDSPVASTSSAVVDREKITAVSLENDPEPHIGFDDDITDVLTQESIDILKLLPDRNFDEIYAYLESHYYDPNRVDVVISELKNITQEPKNNKTESDDKEIQNTWDKLKDLFPDADPDFLFDKAQECFRNNDSVDTLVCTLLDKRDYPKLTEVMKEHESNIRKRKFIERNFSAEEFLEMYEDPVSHFYDETTTPSRNYKSHATIQLWNTFPNIYRKYISSVLQKHNFHFIPALRELENKFKPMKRDSIQPKRVRLSEKIFKKHRGSQVALPDEVDEIFYKELAFSEIEKNLRKKLKEREETRELKLEQAREYNTLLTCSCCFDDEVLAEDVLTCNDGHIFCKGCIKKSSEIKIGERKTKFPCLTLDCKGDIPLSVIKQVVKPVVFSKLLQLMQEEEIQQANIPDLVSCPFCSFSAIMSDPNDKIFRCMNPDCSKESCRLCRELSHIPLRCDEVENSKETNMRTFIENKMSEMMLRTCYKCNRRFIKEGGCNKMTCTCGASMCYICRKPITDYSHFTNGTCPQFSDDFKFLRRELVSAAQKARKDFVKGHPELANVELKHDPLQHLPEQTLADPGQPFNIPPFNYNAILMRLYDPNLRQQAFEFFRQNEPYMQNFQQHNVENPHLHNIQHHHVGHPHPPGVQNFQTPNFPNAFTPIGQNLPPANIQTPQAATAPIRINHPPIVLNPQPPNIQNAPHSNVQNRPVLRPARFQPPIQQPIEIQRFKTHTILPHITNFPILTNPRIPNIAPNITQHVMQMQRFPPTLNIATFQQSPTPSNHSKSSTS